MALKQTCDSESSFLPGPVSFPPDVRLPEPGDAFVGVEIFLLDQHSPAFNLLTLNPSLLLREVVCVEDGYGKQGAFLIPIGWVQAY